MALLDDRCRITITAAITTQDDDGFDVTEDRVVYDVRHWCFIQDGPAGVVIDVTGTSTVATRRFLVRYFTHDHLPPNPNGKVAVIHRGLTWSSIGVSRQERRKYLEIETERTVGSLA